MPQLWTETIITQYFWLILILFGFYYIAVTQLIPQIAFTLKARRDLESGVTNKDNNLSQDSINPNSLLNNSKILLSSILSPQLSKSTKNNNLDAVNVSLKSARDNWLSQVK